MHSGISSLFDTCAQCTAIFVIKYLPDTADIPIRHGDFPWLHSYVSHYQRVKPINTMDFSGQVSASRLGPVGLPQAAGRCQGVGPRAEVAGLEGDLRERETCQDLRKLGKYGEIMS